MSDTPDNDLSNLHKKTPPIKQSASKKTRVIQPSTRVGKKSTWKDTLRNVFSGGDFIVADDPQYKRKIILRVLRILTLALLLAFIGLFAYKVKQQHDAQAHDDPDNSALTGLCLT